VDIGSLLNQAGGIGAIARQLGVDESLVERGAGALLPHVQNGVETQGLPNATGAEMADPQPADPQVAQSGQGGMFGGGSGSAGGLGGMLGGLMGGGAGGVLGSLVGGGVGNEILGHIFGSKDKSRDVASEASQQSGVDTSVLKKLLPIVAGAVAMHYITKRRQSGAAADAGGAQAGGGGILGSILGGTGGL
jgi:hypothetical protein